MINKKYGDAYDDEDELVFDDDVDDLTWGIAVKAVGVEELDI